MTGNAVGETPLRSDTRKALALFALGALIMAASVSPYWRMTPDAALYTGIGKSLATGEGYTFSGETQYSISPVMPVCFALVYRAAHLVRPELSFLDTVLYFNAFCALVGTAGLVGAYFLTRELAGAKRALLVLLFLVVSRRYHSYSLRQLTDVPYCAVSWAALFCVLRAQSRPSRGCWIAAAFLLTLAPLVRLTGVTLVLSVTCYFGVALLSGAKRRKGALAGLLATVGGLIAVGLFAWVVWTNRGAGTYNYYDHFFRGLPPAELAKRYLVNLWDLVKDLYSLVAKRERLAALPFLLLLVRGGFLHWRSGNRLPVVYVLAYTLYVPFGQRIELRYGLPLLPFLYVFSIEAIAEIGRLIAARFSGKTARSALRAAAVLLVMWLVAINAKRVYREIAYNYSGDFYGIHKTQPYLDVANALAENPPKGPVMVERARIIGALSGVDTRRLLFYPKTEYQHNIEGVRRFVQDKGIVAVVVDHFHMGTAELFDAFVREGPHLWDYKGTYGQFSLYTFRSGPDRKAASAERDS